MDRTTLKKGYMTDFPLTLAYGRKLDALRKKYAEEIQGVAVGLGVPRYAGCRGERGWDLNGGVPVDSAQSHTAKSVKNSIDHDFRQLRSGAKRIPRNAGSRSGTLPWRR